MIASAPDRPLNILLVANYKPDRQRSMARYAGLLRGELNRRGHHAEIIRPAPVFTRLVPAEHRLFRWLAYIDKFLLFPPVLRLRARRYDLVHVCDHSNSFYLRWTGSVPALITAHDALAIRSALGQFPQNPTRATGVRLQRWILHNLAYAAHIICVSEKTRQDFSALLRSAPPMTVIPNVLGEDFHPASADEVATARAACGLKSDEEYLLHVGGDVWYKNRPGAVRIFTELRKYPRFAHTRMVMVGNAFPDDLRALAAQSGGVIECVGPSDSQLQGLYTGALALLFPSLEEGFGWPILEAQACGCPVITSNRPPMSEVAGDAAILIDPEDPAAAAAEITRRIDEAEILRAAGFRNLSRYTADAAFSACIAVYQNLAGGGSSRAV